MSRVALSHQHLPQAVRGSQLRVSLQHDRGAQRKLSRGILPRADTLPTPTPTRFRAVGACRWPDYRHRQPFRVGATDKANGAAGFSVGWHPAPAIPMPATPVLSGTLLITSRSCAAPLQCRCGARMQNIWAVDAYCIPDVHGRSCLIPERSWLARLLWKPRKGPLFLLSCGRRYARAAELAAASPPPP